MSEKSLGEEYLSEIRLSYTRTESAEGRIINELLDEIDRLDDLLANSEDEVERLRKRVEPKAVSGSVSRTPNGKWRARWRDEDGKQHSMTFERKHDARCWLGEAKSRRIGGAW